MSPSDFSTWLRGFMAALGTAPMSAAQMETVRQELSKVTTPYQFMPVPAPWPTTPWPEYWWGGVGGVDRTICGGGLDLGWTVLK